VNTTLAERFAQALASSGLEKAEVERRVSGKAGGHLTHVLAGRRKNLSHDMLSSYATVLGVRAEWLGGGEPPMRADGLVITGSVPAGKRFVDREDRYPSRPPVLAAARAKGIDKAAIDAVAEVRLKGDEDPGTDYWMQEIEAWAARAKRLGLAAESTQKFDDAALVAAPAPKSPSKRAQRTK